MDRMLSARTIPLAAAGALAVAAGWLTWWLSGAGPVSVGLAMVGGLLLGLGLGFGRARTAAEAPSGERRMSAQGADLQEQLELVRRRSEGAAERHREWVGAVSHDLRSPIGAILNYAAILEEDLAGEISTDELHMLSRIRSSAGTAVDRIEALLELSRLHQCELEKEVVDMTSLAREVAESCVDASVRTLVEPLPSLQVDPKLMRRVLRELLTNASRHSLSAEEPTITVTGGSDDSRSTIRVSDNGKGFDMRYRGKLFKPFERIDPADEKSGVGIGLAVVAEIVRRHEGTLSVESSPGEGASFQLELPRDGAA